jgi:hypothetical protein
MSSTSTYPLYASFDVETDGNNPLQHSMRSIGIVLFDTNARVVGTFYQTFVPQPHGTVEAKCKLAFWDRHPLLWEEVTSNAVPIAHGIARLVTFLQSYPRGNIKWVASPANFDWMWLKCYYEHYGPPHKPDIGFFCHDLVSLLRSYTLLKGIKNKMQLLKKLSGNREYSHHALDDAMYQGIVYMNLRKLLSLPHAQPWNRPIV